MKMLELADGELELETMGLLMGKLMKNTPNITIQSDENNHLVANKTEFFYYYFSYS